MFYESQMTFGARSSPDWCNVPRSIPLEMALMETKMWKDCTAKVLDDVVVFGYKGSGKSKNVFLGNFGWSKKLSSLAPALLCSNLLIQHSKFQFRNKRSKAEAIISVH